MKKTFAVAAVVAVVALSVAGSGALPNHSDQGNSATSTQQSMAGEAMHGQMTTTETMSGAMAGETMGGTKPESSAMESQTMADVGKMTDATSMSMERPSISSMIVSDNQAMTAYGSNSMSTTPAMAQ
jgi:hypothetical protein